MDENVVDPVAAFIARASAGAEAEVQSVESIQLKVPARSTPGSDFAVEAGARVQPGRPKPEGLLSPEERAERQRQHNAAVAAGQRDPGLHFDPAPPEAETFLIHFLEDGFTAFGAVWYRGQELEVAIGSERWEQGKHWLRWTDFDQMERCGKIYFRQGQWPGKRSYTEAAGGFQRLTAIGSTGEVTGPSLEQLQAADEAERRRNRGVPRVPGF